MSRALVILGHGSSRNPATRKPVCACVQAIREQGLYDEVRCGLLKEDPKVADALTPLKSETITVVPLFISDGYYTRTVIPGEMGLSGARTRRDGKNIYYAQPVGGHPLFAELIWQMALKHGFTTGQTLVVLGHGTPRNPDSATNVFLQAERLRRAHRGISIQTRFIDQEPGLEGLRQLEGDAVMVPLFIADGWHVTETIPEDLGIENGALPTRGGQLRYTPAVGTDPGLVDVVLQAAARAEAVC